MMVGRELGDLFPPKRPPLRRRSRCCATEALSVAGRVRDVSIELRAGEIVGAGRHGRLRPHRTGARPVRRAADHGRRDRRRRPRASPRCRRRARSRSAWASSPRTASRRGWRCCSMSPPTSPAPRSDEVTERLLIDRRQESAIARREIERYRIACRGPQTAVATMSGGNQQKVDRGALGADLPHRADPRRADARRRRRREGGNLPHHARTRRPRARPS